MDHVWTTIIYNHSLAGFASFVGLRLADLASNTRSDSCCNATHGVMTYCMSCTFSSAKLIFIDLLARQLQAVARTYHAVMLVCSKKD